LARFRQVDQVEQALGVVLRAGVIGAGEHEAAAPNRGTLFSPATDRNPREVIGEE